MRKNGRSTLNRHINEMQPELFLTISADYLESEKLAKTANV
jgi:hypothetical protein